MELIRENGPEHRIASAHVAANRGIETENNMTIETRKFLVLSTSHVTEKTAHLLDTTPVQNWPVAGGPYGTFGWFIYAHDEDAEGNIPEELMGVFRYAREHGCDNVLFDCDAGQIDGLPTYEW